MSAFGGLTLTNRGKILQSKAQTGVQLKYTRMGIGDGDLAGASIATLIGLKNEVKSLNLSKFKVMGDGIATVGAVLSNQNLARGFYFRELGIFAQDPDIGEILYCYGNAGNLAEYIPIGGTDTIEKNIDVQMAIGNAANVTATINTSLVWETIDGSQEKANKAEQNAKAYIDTKVSTITPAAIGAETPSGAQAKANTAEQNAKTYADAKETPAGAQAKANAAEANAKGYTDQHAADYVKHPGFGTTTGSANTYAVSLNPAPIAYVDGMALTVKINVDSTGASTLNVNGLGPKSLKKSNGTDITNLKTGGIYTFRFNSTTQNFILQGEGASGNASASDLLSGKTASTDAGEITGNMPNKGAVTITPGTADQSIPLGFHSGQGKVLGDPNLIAAYILKGITMFGVLGTAPGRRAVGTAPMGTSLDVSQVINSNSVTTHRPATFIRATGISFLPSAILAYYTYNGIFYFMIYKNDLKAFGHQNGNIIYGSLSTGVNGTSYAYVVSDASANISITNTGFSLPFGSNNFPDNVNYIAIE